MTRRKIELPLPHEQILKEVAASEDTWLQGEGARTTTIWVIRITTLWVAGALAILVATGLGYLKLPESTQQYLVGSVPTVIVMGMWRRLWSHIEK